MLKRLTVMGVVLGLIAVPTTLKASATLRVPANLMAAPFDDPPNHNEGDQHQGDAFEDANDLEENDNDLLEDQKDDEMQSDDHDDLNDNDKDTVEDRADDAQEDQQQEVPHRG